jgi:hypothetical protein
MILRMYAIDSIAIHSVDDDDKDEDESILHNTEWWSDLCRISVGSHVSSLWYRITCLANKLCSIQSMDSLALLLPTPLWQFLQLKYCPGELVKRIRKGA